MMELAWAVFAVVSFLAGAEVMRKPHIIVMDEDRPVQELRVSSPVVIVYRQGEELEIRKARKSEVKRTRGQKKFSVSLDGRVAK